MAGAFAELATLGDMKSNSNTIVRVWVVVGMLAYVALPWYSVPGVPLAQALGQVFGGPDTANGIAQALVHGRKWLLVGLMGLVLAVMAVGQAGRRGQARLLMAGGLLGSVGLAAGAWLIGPQGWTQEFLKDRFSGAAVQQPPMGPGAWVAFGVLIALFALGVSRAARAAGPA